MAYNLKTISNKDGLSNSAILSMCQDNQGFMWFGSCDGLNYYNGETMHVYKPTDSPNDLSGNFIYDIIESEKGTLWVATNYGLDRFNYLRQEVKQFGDLSGDLLITKDDNNRIYVHKGGHSIYYYCFFSAQFKKFELDIDDEAIILSIQFDTHDRFWVFTSDGNFNAYKISFTDKDKINVTKERIITHSKPIQYCFHEGDISYFIDVSGELYLVNLLDSSIRYQYNLQPELVSKGLISSVVKFHDDYFIGFKSCGLLQLKSQPHLKDGFVVQDININTGIFSLYKDENQDILWIGTDCYGVILYYNDPYQIRQTTFEDMSLGLKKPLRCLLYDEEESLWIGTKGDGLIRIKDYQIDKPIYRESITRFANDNSLLNNNLVFALEKSRHEILWIGHDEGVNYYSYKEKKIKNVILLDSLNSLKNIHCIYELNDTTLYLASAGEGIFKASISKNEKALVLSNIKRITIGDGSRQDNYFFTIHPESDSSLVFGNRGNGIVKVNNRGFSHEVVSLAKGYNNHLINDVICVTIGQPDNLWCGTSLGLANLSGNGDLSVYNETNGLPNNTIHGILHDSRDNLWLSTNNGIVKFNTKKKTIQEYNQFNGLSIIEFSDGAYYKDYGENTMFFGGINGFLTIQETDQLQKHYAPNIRIDNLTTFGEPRNMHDYIVEDDYGNVLNLENDQNVFSVTFKVNDYIYGNNYAYYYKLEGINDNWINNGNSSKISFTNLKHGTYKVLLKYVNNITETESKPFILQINIAPPWYHTKLAYLFYFLLFVLIIVLVVFSNRLKYRKKQELAIERIEQRHKEERYESKLLFFTNIAHEFCTPLALIEGPCNQLLSYKHSDSYISRYVNLIKQNANRLSELIKDLVEFRRIETGNRKSNIENVDLVSVLHTILDTFSGVIELRRIKFIRNIPSTLLWNTDKKFITIILTNLLSNAFKYVNVNGDVEIQVLADERILKIEVKNTGSGILPGDIKYIFDRYRILDNFEKQDNDMVRNGLGMAITQNLVKLLDGHIEVESVPGKFTLFKVSLPIQSSVDVSIDYIEFGESLIQNEPNIINDAFMLEEDIDKVEPEYKILGNRKTILIVDDNPDILWFIGDIFSEKFNVLVSKTPLNVQRMLAQDQPDIILCDIMMPELDGISLTKMIKGNKSTAHIPMILISAKHNVEDKIKGLSAGAEMYITKPFNVEFLKASVERLILHKETLKTYFKSPLSAFVLNDGKLKHKEDKEFVNSMARIINNNITNKELSAKFIASEMNVSVRYLYRRLEKMEVDSPTKLIRDSRLYVAEHLLIETKLTIDEIKYKSGFSNKSGFFKTFQQKNACTPSEYRASRHKELSDVSS